MVEYYEYNKTFLHQGILWMKIVSVVRESQRHSKLQVTYQVGPIEVFTYPGKGQLLSLFGCGGT
jgi:hypothetical protein